LDHRKRRRGVWNTNTTYRADITYEFFVGGKKYSGSRISYGRLSGSLEDAQNLLKKYPAGATVPVYYDPADLQNRAIEKGFGKGVYIMLFVGVAFVLVAFVILYSLV
jgi:hypothetical protein